MVQKASKLNEKKHNPNVVEGTSGGHIRGADGKRIKPEASEIDAPVEGTGADTASSGRPEIETTPANVVANPPPPPRPFTEIAADLDAKAKVLLAAQADLNFARQAVEEADNACRTARLDFAAINGEYQRAAAALTSGT